MDQIEKQDKRKGDIKKYKKYKILRMSENRIKTQLRYQSPTEDTSLLAGVKMGWGGLWNIHNDD